MKDNKKPTPDESEQINEQLNEAAEQVTEETDIDDGAYDASPVASEDEWRRALETAVKQRDEYLSMAQRTQADFQNFKRRNAQTRTDGFNDGVAESMTGMLPVIDNLERALAAAEEQGDKTALAEGVQMVYRQMMDECGKLGLTEIPALGEAFDPEKHNAVMRAEEGEPGTVLEVFQKGYRLKDRIIRYAMVKVAAE